MRNTSKFLIWKYCAESGKINAVINKNRILTTTAKGIGSLGNLIVL